MLSDVIGEERLQHVVAELLDLDLLAIHPSAQRAQSVSEYATL
jgi:hypothetical protein